MIPIAPITIVPNPIAPITIAPIVLKNTTISQMRVFLAPCRELEGDITDCPACYKFLTLELIFLIHAPYTGIVAFWNVSSIVLTIL